jgi:AcrR family transcriptional regulator
MENENVRELLIQATMKLLSKSDKPTKITARLIAGEANVNLAMINYYFQSKDALVNIAVSRIMEDRAEELKQIRISNLPPRQRLKEFLIAMSDITNEYSELTKPTIPFLLLEGDIELPYYILPMIKEHFGDRRSETQCRIMAYEMISFTQLIFYRSSDFLKYTGVDIDDKKQRNALFQTMLDNYMGE